MRNQPDSVVAGTRPRKYVASKTKQDISKWIYFIGNLTKNITNANNLGKKKKKKEAEEQLQ